MSVSFKEEIKSATIEELRNYQPAPALDPFALFFADIELSDFRSVSARDSQYFLSAWTRTVIAEDIAAGCGEYIASFWLERPMWFHPTLGDLRQLRRCLMVANEFVPSPPASDAQLVREATADLLMVAYAPRVELALRAELRAESRVALPGSSGELTTFASMLAAGTVLRRLLEEGLTGSVPYELDESDAKLWGHFSTTSGGVFRKGRMGELVNTVWVNAELSEVPGSALPYWKALIGVDTAEEVEFESNRVAVMEDAKRVFLNRATMYQSAKENQREHWDWCVGQSIRQLEPHAQIKECLTLANMGRPFESSPDPFVLLSDNAPKTVAFYRCILESVEAGTLTASATSVGTLMHMAWMVGNGLAFVLDRTGLV